MFFFTPIWIFFRIFWEIASIFATNKKSFIKGFRLDQNNELQKTGEALFSNIKDHLNDNGYSNGFYQADIKIGKNVRKMGCYFPSHWDEDRVLFIAEHILENPLNVGMCFKNKKTVKLIVNGMYDGTKIRVIIDDTKTIIDVYPIRQ